MRALAPAPFAVLASPQDEKKKTDNSRVMAVQGCVNGSMLDVHHEDLGRGINSRVVSNVPDPATDPTMNVESFRDEPHCSST